MPDKSERKIFDPGKSGKNPPKPERIVNDKDTFKEDDIEDLIGVFDEEVEQIEIDDLEEEDSPLRAVVLLSGGMDSVAALGWGIEEGMEVEALIMDYGASNSKEEIKAAIKVAEFYDIPCEVIKLNVPMWNRGLTAENPDIYHKDSKVEEVAGEYVPARNTVFLAYAYAYAESKDLDAIIVGFNAGLEENDEDAEFGYMPDTSPVYCRSWQYVINTSTAREKYTIALMAPFLRATKADIAEYAEEHGVPLHLSYSCFKGEEVSCGICRTCVARLRAFEAAGLEDRIPYQDKEFYKERIIPSNRAEVLAKKKAKEEKEQD